MTAGSCFSRVNTSRFVEEKSLEEPTSRRRGDGETRRRRRRYRGTLMFVSGRVLKELAMLEGKLLVAQSVQNRLRKSVGNEFQHADHVGIRHTTVVFSGQANWWRRNEQECAGTACSGCGMPDNYALILESGRSSMRQVSKLTLQVSP